MASSMRRSICANPLVSFDHVSRLKKSLHGFEQAPRAWFHRFSSFLLSKGFICSKVHPSMFVYRQQTTIMVLLLYVDNMLLTGNNHAFICTFIATLSAHFSMKDLGDLHYFLGVQVVQTSSGRFLSQNKYVSDLLRKFHFHTLEPVHTPSVSRTTLPFTDGELLTDPKGFAWLGHCSILL